MILPKKREEAVEKLGRVGSADPAAYLALTGALKDPNPRVHNKAGRTLKMISGGWPFSGAHHFRRLRFLGGAGNGCILNERQQQIARLQ